MLGEKGAVARLARGAEDGFQFAAGIHLRAAGVAFHPWHGGQECFDIPTQGDAVKEAHGVDGDVDAGGRLVALLDEVVQPVGDLLIGDLIGRTPVVARQISDVAGVGLLGAYGPATNGQVPDIFCSK